MPCGRCLGCRGAQRRPRRADLGVPARRRVGLHARAGDGIRVNASAAASTSPAALGDVDAVEFVRGPQSAVFGAGRDRRRRAPDRPARRQPTAAGQIEGGGQATLAPLAPRAARRRLVLGGSVERDRRATGSRGLRRQPARRSPTTTGGSRGRRARRVGHGSATADPRLTCAWFDSERGFPGRTAATQLAPSPRRPRLARRRHAAPAWLTPRLPWGSVLAGRVRQRWQVDLGRPRQPASQQPSAPRSSKRAGVSARAQTDVVLTPTTGLTAGVEGFGERARSTYITGAHVPAGARSSAARLAASREVRQELGARAALPRGARSTPSAATRSKATRTRSLRAPLLATNR